MRIIAADAVDLSIGRENVVDIANHRRCVIEDGFGNSVFAVIAIAFDGIRPTLIPAGPAGIFLAIGPAVFRIHIPNLAIFVDIGGLISGPESAIAPHGMRINQMEQGRF